MAALRASPKNIIAGLTLAASIAAYFISPFEGEKYTAYQDGIGVWTICRGHTKGVTKGMTAKKEQCDAFYADDVRTAENFYDSMVTAKLPENVKAASISFIFNAGPGNFSTSTLRRKLNDGDRVGACNEFPRWNRAGGKDCRIKANKCAGLIERREREKELCLSNEHVVCDYNSGDCQPVGAGAAQPVSVTTGSKTQG